MSTGITTSLNTVKSGSMFAAFFLIFAFAFFYNDVDGQTKQNQKCVTTDPTYLVLEKLQLDAYTENPRARDMFLSPEALKKANEGVSVVISQMPDSLGFGTALTGKDSEIIDKKVAALKLPTCYETPGVYFLLTEYVKEIEKARKQLKLPLKIIPKYGSLPTRKVNAYTYPADPPNKTGSFVMFNTQLFMFDYQMLKVLVPTIDVSHDPVTNKVLIDTSAQAALKSMEDPDRLVNFNMALLEFMLLVEPSTQPLDRKYLPLFLNLVGTAELFAVGHEYAHLIKGHNSNETRKLHLALSNNSPSAIDPTVVVRSWQQELEADEMGLKLVAQVVKNRIASSRNKLEQQSNEMRQLDAFIGALLFFKFSEIIEKANYIKENGKPRKPYSKEEVEFIRAFADGKSTPEQLRKFKELTLLDHPPDWLRLERSIKVLSQYLKQAKITKDTAEYSKIGLALIRNIDVLWDISLPRFPTLLKALSGDKTPFEIGYVVSPRVWPQTFLYNPNLRLAINMFLTGNGLEAEILEQYSKAVKQDWLLLSGLQVPWAEREVSNNSKKRSDALAVIALSGDIQSLNFLERIDTTSWIESDRLLLVKVQKFLEKYGRNTSVAIFENTSPKTFKVTDLLCFPAQMERNIDFASLIPKETSSETIEFLGENSAVEIDRSLSRMALYAIYSKTDKNTSLWVDLIREAGKPDLALQYAQAAEPTAALENAIGNMLSDRRDLNGANRHYEAAIKLGRIDGWPEINMAINFADLGELQKAEYWYREGLKRRTTARSEIEFARYLNEFAWFLVTKLKGSTEKSKEALVFSLESNKILRYSNPNYLDTLAECLAANGDTASAIKTARAALALVPIDSPEHAKYVKRLEEFEGKLKKKDR